MKTNHKSLKELMSQVIQTLEQQFYLTKLLGFQYEITYRSRKSNTVADALSRQRDFTAYCNTLSVVQNPIIVAIQRANEELKEMREWHLQYEQGRLPFGYTIKEGMVFFQNRILVPNVQELKREIFHAYHEIPIGGH